MIVSVSCITETCLFECACQLRFAKHVYFLVLEVSQCHVMVHMSQRTQLFGAEDTRNGRNWTTETAVSSFLVGKWN